MVADLLLKRLAAKADGVKSLSVSGKISSNLVLMLAVAVAMLAFLLAFLTVAISHSNVYSLSAGAVLTAGLVVIVLRMHWFELEVFGILASYQGWSCIARSSMKQERREHDPPGTPGECGPSVRRATRFDSIDVEDVESFLHVTTLVAAHLGTSNTSQHTADEKLIKRRSQSNPYFVYNVAA